MARRVFVCLAGGYLISYALRAINAAIAPELVAEFGLTNATLGYLSSAYFLAFASMQLPLGVWLDRFGTRRVNAGLLLVAAGGCGVFALAQDATALWIGRAMIGAGLAGALIVVTAGVPLLVSGRSATATGRDDVGCRIIGRASGHDPQPLGIAPAGLAWAVHRRRAGPGGCQCGNLPFLPRHEPESARAPAGGRGRGFAGYAGISAPPAFGASCCWRSSCIRASSRSRVCGALAHPGAGDGTFGGGQCAVPAQPDVVGRLSRWVHGACGGGAACRWCRCARSSRC
ncbi:MAG: MFS transporter [Burkholderiaceae bacterium]